MKIVINRCYGGFSLSQVGMEYMGFDRMRWSGCSDLPRHDPKLVECVEELGDKANGKHAKLTVVEIPDGVKYSVEEHEGMEWIAEEHRTWR
ncbi:unnamed protein product [marine sediment metagenome]|uniref:Uncharacterized protein n=1 Tax=marine sediment metagenome TaxID=412755 RepID=X1V9V5_9ZZZZ